MSKYGDVFYFFFPLKIWCLFCILKNRLLFSIYTEFYFFHSAKICQKWKTAVQDVNRCWNILPPPPPPFSSKIQVEVCQKTFKIYFQIFMIFFSKIREYVKKYSGYRQVVYCLLYSSFYLPQKDKTSQQDKSFTVQASVTCSNQCLHLFHTHSSEWNSTTSSFVAEHVLLALGLVLHYDCFDCFGFLSCVYICFDMPCTYCEWISILRYIYIYSVLLPVVVRVSGTSKAHVQWWWGLHQ